MIILSQNFKNYLAQDGIKISIIITILNATLLGIALLGLQYEKPFEPLSFLILMTEIIYGVFILFKIKKNKALVSMLLPFLFLNWFIGCFSLNILMNVFEYLPVWVYVCTFVFCFSTFFIYGENTDKVHHKIAVFVNGASVLLILYFTVYLIPIMPYSFFGTMALGIGFYGLVPLLVLIWNFYFILKIVNSNKKAAIPFTLGILSTLVFLLIFTLKINFETNTINQYSVTKSFENTSSDLPTYIRISQKFEPNFFNEIILKKGIVYVGSENIFTFNSLRSLARNQFNDRKIHNPIYNIAYLFSSKLDLTADDRINILKFNFDKRLQTEEQLWSGNDLFTKNIKEDIKIFPKDRLSYTEITMDIACDKNSWEDKEAIYSFQLPENAVATSLSLWVNGLERKAVLTTKEKAVAAYRQIVGIEARDPSLMQWREGNRVVVRIFPIRHDLPRTFKCGFTSPLKLDKNELKYQTVKITGPNLAKAKTLSRIQVMDNKKFKSSKNFEFKDGFYVDETNGIGSWTATVSLPNDDQFSGFVWKGKRYQTRSAQLQTIAFVPSEIVLDLNKNWNFDELQAILKIHNNNFFVFINNQKQSVNAENAANILKQFTTLEYSLLPFFDLEKNSLIVTKSGDISANFEELSDTKYLKKVKQKIKEKHLKVINISPEINPLWYTLKEQKYVDLIHEDIVSAIELISNNKFQSIGKEENSVYIESSQMAISEVEALPNIVSSGSNHLYRMYAFCKVLDNQMDIQADTLAKNKFVDLAKDANIVTPISSLIVLETDQDYANNGIEKNVNTLENANINNDGAVPEPEEWALILVGLLSIVLYIVKNRQSKTTRF